MAEGPGNIRRRELLGRAGKWLALVVASDIIYLEGKVATYTIKPGDTLYEIGQRLGFTVQQLEAANPGIRPRDLRVGQVINLPGKTPVPTPTPTPPPPPPPASTPSPPPAGTFKFADEFDGPGSAPDPTKWVLESGPQSGGNPGASGNYVPSNCFVDGNSNLIIRAQSATSSGRMNTLGKFSQLYGSFEAKLKFSHNAGCWPAWWCMGANPSSYPECGEVDIWEVYGNDGAPDTTVWTPAGGNMANNKSVSVPAMSDGNWHTWQMDWTKDAGFKFFQDGSEYLSVAPSELPNWCYGSGNPFYMVLNLTLGGSGGGNSFSGTQWPVDLLCDYIHIWL